MPRPYDCTGPHRDYYDDPTLYCPLGYAPAEDESWEHFCDVCINGAEAFGELACDMARDET